jgi:hypothetical protein
MDLEAFLRLHDADLHLLVEGAQTIAALAPGDRLIAVGSLAEGLGNRKSDVDLLLVTPRAQHSEASPDEVRSFVVGRCIVDMRIVPAALALALQSRLRTWAQSGWNLTVAADFTASELLLLHRLSAGRRLWPSPEASQDDADPTFSEDVARLKLHVARHMARTLQVDMVGYREVGDGQSLVYSAQDLLGHAVDGLLAGFRLTNPTPKWRSRLLDRLPADWESRLVMRPSGLKPSDLIWRLHRAPAEASAIASLDHACRIVTFARAAFLWAEESLIHAWPGVGRRYVWPERPARRSEPPLPFLHLDVDFCRTEDGVAVGRLNEFGETLHMTFNRFAVMLLFDNFTTAREAARVIEGEAHDASAHEAPADGLEQFALQVQRSGFSIAA